MPLVKTKPMRFRPRSLADTLDGTNSPAGAASALINLIADPSTPACLQCRPAAEILSSYVGFNQPGVISEAVQVNGRVYGLIASQRFPGHDEPFVFDLTSQSFATVTGATILNTPLTQASSGDWTPPSSVAVGTRVIFTHPGFAGLGDGNYFGYFDTSGYSDTENGNTTSGSDQITGNIQIAAVGPGFTISGTGIPVGSVVTNVQSVTPQATGTTTNGSAVIASVTNFTDVGVGQTIAGIGIPTNATILALDTIAQTITMSANATASGTVTISMAGTLITISNNATATGTVAISIFGGTVGQPLWCAGNTTNIPLASPPQGVSIYNNRPYFAVANALTFCDPLSLNISEADGNPQTLTVGDTSWITCITPLTIINPATAAPVAGLLVFKEKLVSLVTGDPTTSNLAVNTLSPAGVGTVSPKAVAATTVGVYFPAPDGLRCIELSGNVTDPLPDVRVPFITAINPTRMSGAFNSGIYRCCLQSGTAAGTPFQEYWFDLTHKMWNGPHTFQQNVITPWKGTFIAFSNVNSGILYQTDPVQTAVSNFTENGQPLSWLYATCALPDEGDLMYNSLVVASINVAFKAGAPTLTCIATDEDGTVLGVAAITTPGAASYWGSMVWGTSVWYGQQYGLRAHQIPWTAPVVFSKLVLTVKAESSLGFQISNFQALYQPLGYVSTPVGVAVNSSPPPAPPPVAYLWDAGYSGDTAGLNWQG